MDVVRGELEAVSDTRSARHGVRRPANNLTRSRKPGLRQPLGPLVSSHVRECEHHWPVAYHSDGQLGPGGHRPVQPGFIEFSEDGLGSLGFIAVTGDLDCRAADRDGQPGAEFSWQGSDEGDDASGRGWAALNPDGTLEGHIYFHLGDDSAFRAERFNKAVRWATPLKPRRSKRSAAAERREVTLETSATARSPPSCSPSGMRWAMPRCGRAELLLVLCFPAASPRRQASSVADVTGKTSAQRWRDTNRPAKAQVSEPIEYSGGRGEFDLMCI